MSAYAAARRPGFRGRAFKWPLAAAGTAAKNVLADEQGNVDRVGSREVVVRIRSESDDLREQIARCNESVVRLDALLRTMEERLIRGARPPALLDKRDVAERLGVSVRQVDRLVAAGALPPALRIGTAPRWRPEQIEAFVAAGPAKRRNQA